MSCGNCPESYFCRHPSPFYPASLWNIIGGKHFNDIWNNVDKSLDTRAYGPNIVLSKETGLDDAYHDLCPELEFGCTTLPFKPYITLNNGIGDINTFPCNSQLNTDLPFNMVSDRGTSTFGLPTNGRRINGETSTDLSMYYIFAAFANKVSYNALSYSRAGFKYVIPNTLDIINSINCDSFIRMGNGDIALSFTRPSTDPIIAVTDNFYLGFEPGIIPYGSSFGEFPLFINNYLNDVLWTTTFPTNVSLFQSSGQSLYSTLSLFLERYNTLPSSLDVNILIPATQSEQLIYQGANPQIVVTIRNELTGEIYQGPNTSYIYNTYGIIFHAGAFTSYFNNQGINGYIWITKTLQLGTDYLLLNNATAEIFWVNEHERMISDRNQTFKKIETVCGVQHIASSGYIGFDFLDAYNYRDLRNVPNSPNSIRESGIPNPNPYPVGFPNYDSGILNGALLIWDDATQSYHNNEIRYYPCYEIADRKYSLVEFDNPNYPDTLKFYRDKNFVHNTNEANGWIYYIYPSGKSTGYDNYLSLIPITSYTLQYSGENINDYPIIPINTSGYASGTIVSIYYSPLYGNTQQREELIDLLESIPQFSGIREYWDFMCFDSYNRGDIPIDLIRDKLNELSANYHNYNANYVYERYPKYYYDDGYSNKYTSSQNIFVGTWTDKVSYITNKQYNVKYLGSETQCANSYPQLDYPGVELFNGYLVDINIRDVIESTYDAGTSGIFTL